MFATCFDSFACHCQALLSLISDINVQLSYRISQNINEYGCSSVSIRTARSI